MRQPGLYWIKEHEGASWRPGEWDSDGHGKMGWWHMGWDIPSYADPWQIGPMLESPE